MVTEVANGSSLHFGFGRQHSDSSSPFVGVAFGSQARRSAGLLGASAGFRPLPSNRKERCPPFDMEGDRVTFCCPGPGRLLAVVAGLILAAPSAAWAAAPYQIQAILQRG